MAYFIAAYSEASLASSGLQLISEERKRFSLSPILMRMSDTLRPSVVCDSLISCLFADADAVMEAEDESGAV